MPACVCTQKAAAWWCPRIGQDFHAANRRLRLWQTRCTVKSFRLKVAHGEIEALCQPSSVCSAHSNIIYLFLENNALVVLVIGRISPSSFFDILIHTHSTHAFNQSNNSRFLTECHKRRWNQCCVAHGSTLLKIGVNLNPGTHCIGHWICQEKAKSPGTCILQTFCRHNIDIFR